MAILNEDILNEFLTRTMTPGPNNRAYAEETKALMMSEEPAMLQLIDMANVAVHPAMGAGIAIMWRLIRDSQCSQHSQFKPQESQDGDQQDSPGSA